MPGCMKSCQYCHVAGDFAPLCPIISTYSSYLVFKFCPFDLHLFCYNGANQIVFSACILKSISQILFHCVFVSCSPKNSRKYPALIINICK